MATSRRIFLLLPLLAAFLATLVACKGVSTDPDIWNLRTDPALRMWLSDLNREIATADIVLAGERHDNPHHHAAQADIVRAAAASGRPVVLVFEMLDTDQQPAIDAFFAAGGGSAPEFAAAVDWQARGWPDPTLYAPLFDAMFDADATIVAGDLPRATIRRIGRDGVVAVPPELAERFGFDRPLPAEIDAEMRDIQYTAHCQLIPQAALGRMVAVQRARDAALAGAILDARARQPDAIVVLIAGAGHVRKDHGVGALLHTNAPGSRTLVIGLDEGAPGSPGFSALPRQYDVVWFSPAVDHPDRCEGLRQRLTR